MEQHRQLVAILFTDIVGYTAIMQKDEEEAVLVIKKHRTVIENTVPSFHGVVHNFYGDGCLCVFYSASEAIHCAEKIQRQLQTEIKVPLRIGLHVGEIFYEDGKIMGDGVNIASRIQSLGMANTVLFSKEIYDKVRNQGGFESVSLGLFEFKNVDEPLEIFALANGQLFVPKRHQLQGKLKKKGTSKLSWIIPAACVVLILISIVLYNRYFHKALRKVEDRSIAVLPFKGIGDSVLSNGLAEDILVRLSKIKQLKVISNKSSFRYANSNKSPREIGQELNVSSLVLGSIQRADSKIRVSAQLIDCNTENIIWAEDYDSEVAGLFDLQTEVAMKIVSALQTNLTVEEKRNLRKNYTQNIEAYRFYKKGRSFFDKRTSISFDSAEANYKRAIELDPDYALAYVGLADCYTYNLKGLSQLVSMPIARDYVNKALALDSTLAEGLTTSGFIEAVFQYNFAKGSTFLQKAIGYDPNYPFAHLYYANLCIQVAAKPALGIQENRIALQLDPLSIQFNYVLGRNYYFVNKLDSAFDQLKKTLILEPQYNLAKASLAHVLLARRNFEEALKLINQLPRSGPSSFQEYQGSLLGYAYALAGDTLRARIELNKTLSENPDQLSYHFASAYALLKDFDKALYHLERGYNSREVSMVFLKIDPTLNPLRNEPRFKALMKKMNLD